MEITELKERLGELEDDFHCFKRVTFTGIPTGFEGEIWKDFSMIELKIKNKLKDLATQEKNMHLFNEPVE